ncbi:MAG: hypothetical protein N2Z70_01740, partial [Bdellovibrionaceae bacterium]|nr:hypothetical protein [Pseudobdellovibrionaceae bacterium]
MCIRDRFIEVELCTIDLWERQEARVRPFYSNGTWGHWYPKFAGADLGLSFEFPRSWGEEEKLLFARRLSSFMRSGNISWLQKAQQARIASDGMIAWQLQKPAVTLLTREEVTGSQMDRVTRVLNFLEKKQIEARVIDATGAKKILVRLRGEP